MLTPEGREFLKRVIPWPTEDRGIYTGYANLHWTFLKAGTSAKGKPLWSGRAFQTLSKFSDFIDWASQQSSFRDIYYCVSRQSSAAVDPKKGTLKAVRLAANAIDLKAIWLDVDVKTPGLEKDKPEYETLDLALEALQAFVRARGLPEPSALVGSGGGVQSYWIFREHLELEKWSYYARRLRQAAEEFGLLFDGGCTIDSARLLRVPCTSNWKTGTARPTRILGLGPDYDEANLEALTRVDLPSGAGTPTPRVDVQAPSHIGRPGQTFMAYNGGRVESIGAGLAPDYPPLEPLPIFRGCEFLRKTMVTRGRGQSEPLWHLALLCAAHLPDGEKFAHAFSDGYAGYSKEETSAKFARKVRERDERGIGWPGCSSIHEAGSTVCGSCPHLARGKSPLNLGTSVRGQPTPGAGSANLPEGNRQLANAGLLHGVPAPTHGGPSGELPTGYVYADDGTICVLVERAEAGEGGPPSWAQVPLFTARLTGAWVSDSPEALHFITTKSLGVTGAVTITAADLASHQNLMDALWVQGAFTNTEGEPFVRKFMTAWISKLREVKKAIETKPFGWLEDATGKKGFMYGGKCFTPNGEEPCGWPEEKLRATYSPKGSAQVWREVSRLITNQQRADLDCILASSFAAPLVGIIGQYSAVISVCGPTGRSKSFALGVANAVWGDYQMAKEVSSSSEKQFIKKMGDLYSLPMYWDDITKQNYKFVYRAFRAATEGKEGGRLKSDRSYAEERSWNSLMLVTSNNSFVDFVTLQDTDTDAGLVRVLEYTVPPKNPATDVGLIKSSDADYQLTRLRHNYGMVGLEYAKMLGSRPEDVISFTRAMVDEFHTAVSPTQEERFWVVACGVLLAGGQFAKMFGADINVPRLRTFLISTFLANRARHQRENLAGGTQTHTQDLLISYLQEFRLNSMWSDGYQRPINVFYFPEHGRSVRLHFATVDRKLRISRTHFREWLKDGMSSFLVTSLEKDYGATYTRGALAGGTSHSAGTETLIEIPVPPGSPMEPLLESHGRIIADAPVGATGLAGVVAAACTQTAPGPC